jgi:hypothetical protein
MNRYDDAAKKEAPTDEEVRVLLERLRPTVYADGKCECCSHSDEEKRAIADTVLRWWLEAHIDGFVASDGTLVVPSEDGEHFEPRPALPERVGHG